MTLMKLMSYNHEKVHCLVVVETNVHFEDVVVVVEGILMTYLRDQLQLFHSLKM